MRCRFSPHNRHTTSNTTMSVQHTSTDKQQHDTTDTTRHTAAHHSTAHTRHTTHTTTTTSCVPATHNNVREALFPIPIHSKCLEACTEYLDKFFLRDASNTPTNEWAEAHALCLRSMSELRVQREPTERVIIVIVIEKACEGSKVRALASAKRRTSRAT